MRELKIMRQITDRENGSLNRYLAEISKEELITAEEEVLLAQKIKAGDQKALEKLAKANLRFVVSVAKQYQNKGLSLPDLINEGNLGLIKAAQRFDETRGFKFISFAVWWIRQSILLALAEVGKTVRIPYNKISDSLKFNKAVSRLEQLYSRSPTIDELAEFLGVTELKVKAFLMLPKYYISIDAPIFEDGGGSIIDLLINADGSSDESIEKKIERLLSILTVVEKQIVLMYFGIEKEPLTYREISSEMELPLFKIKDLHRKAVNRLIRRGDPLIEKCL